MTQFHSHMSYYVDIHNHRGSEQEDEVLALKSLRVCEILSENFDENKAYTLGLHPCFSVDISEDSWQAFRDSFRDYTNFFWGIGECGLDKRSEVALEEQIDIFIRQVMFSEEVQKPLVLHVVKAWNELLAIKRDLQVSQPWIIHGFRGKPELAKQLLDKGFYLSFGAYYNLESFLLAENYGRAFLETDESPNLSIKDVYRRSALELGLEPGELKERYYQRFLSLF